VATFEAAEARVESQCALWVTPTHAVKDKINSDMLFNLQEKGHQIVTCWAHHYTELNSDSSMCMATLDEDVDDDLDDVQRAAASMQDGELLPSRPLPAKRRKAASKSRPTLDDKLHARLLRFKREPDRKAKKDTYGLPIRQSCLKLAIGARVALDHNLVTDLGLVHYATGNVVGLVYPQSVENYFISSFDAEATPQEQRPLPVVMVQFDSKYFGCSNRKCDGKKCASCNTGIEWRNIEGNNMPRVVAIAPEYQGLEYRNHTYYRVQLPLIHGRAITVHSSQSLQSDEVVNVTTPPGKAPFARGLDYVANSRTRSLAGLVVVGRFEERHFNG
jgi:hypothetical protein